ncbi:hypothetical protein L5876_04880 [Hyphobacterium sp. SN044]|uniref:hypothetical protein n=1 Tax=Hyphobacterium sp. SN044 TaxID=2912575 RepID=UPI001F409E40|nr:hypothetical protein [Hyphobacterium sp. SN044]MCF8879146.1 hypothetical protein [Hyphobacterium sp. SN044]
MIIKVEMRFPSIGQAGNVCGAMEFDWPASMPFLQDTELPETCNAIEVYNRETREFRALCASNDFDDSDTEGWWDKAGVVVGLSEADQQTMLEFAKIALSSSRDLSIRIVARVADEKLSGSVRTEADLGFDDVIYGNVAHDGTIPLTDIRFLLHDPANSEHLA